MISENKKSLTLKPLDALEKELSLALLAVRNEYSVRKWMYTEHVIKEDEHLNWVDSLEQNARQKMFAILDQSGEPIGAVGISELDPLHKKCDWAYYLAESARGGLGSYIEFMFIDFVFNNFDVEKLNCEVIEGNDSVVKLHKKFLFEQEGFKQENILKDGVRLGVNLLGLRKSSWVSGRDEIVSRYNRIFDKFELVVEWDA